MPTTHATNVRDTWIKHGWEPPTPHKQEPVMNKAMVLFQLDDLKYNLLRMDANYRMDEKRRTTPQEIADLLKAIRMMRLSTEAGAFDKLFTGREVEL